MDKKKQAIIREWLIEKFKQRGRGAQVALAEHLELDANAVSKMINAQSDRGYRAIRADELLEMAEFFGESPPGLFVKVLPAEQSRINRLFKQIPPEQQRIILALLESLAAAERKK